MRPEWQERVRALAADHVSSSSALALRAGELLDEVAREDPACLAALAQNIVRAQPAMAAVANVANVALRAVETLGAAAVGAALQVLVAAVDADRKAASEALCQRLDAPVGVVTTSASASVVEALQALRRRDLLRGVVCGESRPLLEGTALSRWLADHGYEVTLVTDAALAEHLVAGTVFLAGTDAILPEHVVNKRGTRLYAAWARLAGVERYVLSTRDKLYPPDLVPCFANPERPAEEILRNPPPALHVDNRPFDLTPREAWTEILVGAHPAIEAEARGDRALSPGLRPLLEPGAAKPVAWRAGLA